MSLLRFLQPIEGLWHKYSLRLAVGPAKNYNARSRLSLLAEKFAGEGPSLLLCQQVGQVSLLQNRTWDLPKENQIKCDPLFILKLGGNAIPLDALLGWGNSTKFGTISREFLWDQRRDCAFPFVYSLL